MKFLVLLALTAVRATDAKGAAKGEACDLHTKDGKKGCADKLKCGKTEAVAAVVADPNANPPVAAKAAVAESQKCADEAGCKDKGLKCFEPPAAKADKRATCDAGKADMGCTCEGCKCGKTPKKAAKDGAAEVPET